MKIYINYYGGIRVEDDIIPEISLNIDTDFIEVREGYYDMFHYRCILNMKDDLDLDLWEKVNISKAI